MIDEIREIGVRASGRAGDVVADRPDLIDRPALRVGEVPVDVALAGDVGAGVHPEVVTVMRELGFDLADRRPHETTGLKCPPETGPNMRMIANRPAAWSLPRSPAAAAPCRRRVGPQRPPSRSRARRETRCRGTPLAISLPADSVDVVLSNCVINLSTDKPQALREAARVLKPGAVSDVVADPGMDDATRADMQQYVGCIAGALTRDEYTTYLTAAGLAEIEITQTHRLHEHAGSAIIRARKVAGQVEASGRPRRVGVIRERP